MPEFKTRSITFTFKAVDSNAQKYLSTAVLYDYAFILHDRDYSIKSDYRTLVDPHYHVVLFLESPRTLSSLANEIGIPVNQLQAIRSRKGIIKYLTHSDSNDSHKFVYPVSDITTNLDLAQFAVVDTLSEFEEFFQLKRGKLTAQQFLANHQSAVAGLAFFQRLKTYDLLYSAQPSARLVREARAPRP